MKNFKPTKILAVVFTEMTMKPPKYPLTSRHESWAALGITESPELPIQAVGWGPWRYEWYSICSRPQCAGCSLCKCGRYHNVWRRWIVKHFVPRKLWIWWVNR